MKSNSSRPFGFNSQISHLNSTRKKLQRPKLKKSQMAPWKWHFSPLDFLGLQQSLLNINYSLGIFMSKCQKKKKKAKIYHGDCRISQTGRFWWPLFDSSFHTVNVIFGWNQLYQKNFTYFGNEMSKKFCNYLWRFWNTKETLSPGQRFFSRSTLFNKSFSYSRDLKLGS